MENGELADGELANFKINEELESKYKESMGDTIGNMPETTRLQLSRNLDGLNCTVRQMTSALQFKSLRNVYKMMLARWRS